MSLTLIIPGLKQDPTAYLQKAVRELWRATREQGQNGRLQTLVELGVKVCHVARELDEHLDRGQHHTRVRGSEHRVEHVHNVEDLLVVGGLVATDQIEHLGLGLGLGLG